MTAGSVARRYAKALYELATEDKAVVEIGAALSEVGAAVSEAGADALREGALDADARSAIGDALAGKVGRDGTLGKFLKLVADRDRLGRLPEIAQWYAKLADEAAGRVEVSITAAGALAEPQVEAIRAAFKKIAKREIVARIDTDAEILGGAIVELDGRVYDGSVRTALARLAARMAGSMNGSSSTAGSDK
jgi:F-type H+-transporting ATPase subunit delta